MNTHHNEIQTVQWTETSEMHGDHAHTSPSSHWLRVDPPALAWRNYCEGDSDHNVQDARGIRHTASSWDRIHLDSNHPISIENQLKKLLAPAGDDGASRPTERIVQDGRELLQHTSETVRHNFRIVTTLLSEPDTHHLVRREMHQFDLHTGLEVVATVCESYVYNAAIDPDVFEMPAHLPVEEPDLSTLFPDVWPSLDQDDRLAILQTIENSDAAWLSADMQLFEKEWSFECQSNVPTRRDWSELLRNHSGLWRRWKTEVKEMKKWPRIGVRSGHVVFTSQCFTDSEMANRTMFWIRAYHEVEWADDGDIWQGDADYYLMQFGSKYRILHWEFPLEEMKAAHALRVSK